MIRIEHSIPDSTRMKQIDGHTTIRIWVSADRFYTIRGVDNDTAILVEHFQAPGGLSYAKELHMSPAASHAIVLK